jgi:hypothetical protein
LTDWVFSATYAILVTRNDTCLWARPVCAVLYQHELSACLLACLSSFSCQHATACSVTSTNYASKQSHLASGCCCLVQTMLLGLSETDGSGEAMSAATLKCSCVICLDEWWAPCVAYTLNRAVVTTVAPVKLVWLFVCCDDPVLAHAKLSKRPCCAAMVYCTAGNGCHAHNLLAIAEVAACCFSTCGLSGQWSSHRMAFMFRGLKPSCCLSKLGAAPLATAGVVTVVQCPLDLASGAAGFASALCLLAPGSHGTR